MQIFFNFLCRPVRSSSSWHYHYTRFSTENWSEVKKKLFLFNYRPKSLAYSQRPAIDQAATSRSVFLWLVVVVAGVVFLYLLSALPQSISFFVGSPACEMHSYHKGNTCNRLPAHANILSWKNEEETQREMKCKQCLNLYLRWMDGKTTKIIYIIWLATAFAHSRSVSVAMFLLAFVFGYVRFFFTSPSFACFCF